MQWLIDIICTKCGIVGGYADRGDPVSADYDKGDLIRDNNWHEMDLSAIVPSGVKAILVHIRLLSVMGGKVFRLKKLGTSGSYNTAITSTHVSNINDYADKIVSLDDDRKIEYRTSLDPWTVIQVTVKGWWN